MLEAALIAICVNVQRRTVFSEDIHERASHSQKSIQLTLILRILGNLPMMDVTISLFSHQK